VAKNWLPHRFALSRLVGGIATLVILSLFALPRSGVRPPSEDSRAVSAWYPPESPWANTANWIVVADFDAPWGRETRLRPVCDGIEIRGADIRITTPPASTSPPRHGPTPKRTPGSTLFAPQTGTRNSASTRAKIDRNGSRQWEAESVLSTATWEAVAAWQRREGRRALRPNLAVAQIYVSMRDGTPEFRALGTVPPTSAFGLSIQADGSGGPVEVEAILDQATGAVVAVRDARLHAVGSAQVFDPNPIASSGLADLRDGDPTANFRVWVDLERLDGQGQLHGHHVEVNSDREPRANSSDLVFDYLPYDPRFEEAMAYYHGDSSLELVDSYGFMGLFAVPLLIRVHGTQLDNSWYSRRSKEIVFGDGGVDDAEDADIIIHESGHAIHDALAPGFEGADMFAISEGFSDFWAASMTGDACVGDWDATSYSPPCLRSTDNTAIYPQDLTASPHRNGLIFGGLFWDLRNAIGKANSERLALSTLVELGPRGQWDRVGASVLRAAVRLNLDADPISRILVGRGLLDQSVETEIDPESPLVLDLVVPSLCLGERVTALTLGHDGTIQWSDPSPAGDINSTTEVTPILHGENDSVLRVNVLAGSEGVRITQSWFAEAGDEVRVQTDWNGIDGTVTWTYLQVPNDASNIGFRVGQGVTPTFPHSVELSGPWTRLPLGSGLSGSLGNDSRRLIGGRFEAAKRENETWLERRTPLHTAAWSNLQLSILPNPISPQSEIRLYLEEPGPVSVSIFAADGREVRSVPQTDWFPAGLSRIPLPFHDRNGKALPIGHYWARAQSRGTTATTSFVQTP